MHAKSALVTPKVSVVIVMVIDGVSDSEGIVKVSEGIIDKLVTS